MRTVDHRRVPTVMVDTLRVETDPYAMADRLETRPTQQMKMKALPSVEPVAADKAHVLSGHAGEPHERRRYHNENHQV